MKEIKHKILGTSVLKLNAFIENVKDCAGTRLSITINDFLENEGRICSYSFINKYYKITWNEILTRADLDNKKNFKVKRQGRKKIDKTKYEKVNCLKCNRLFLSWDKRNNRICKNCKILMGGYNDS